MSHLTKHHLDNWTDADFAAHILAVRKTVERLDKLERAAKRALGSNPYNRGQIEAAMEDLGNALSDEQTEVYGMHESEGGVRTSNYSKPSGGAQLEGVAAVAELTPEKLSQRPFEDDPLHATLDAQIAKLTREKIELWDALSKAIDYCDAATHPDQQYADDRPNLLRVMEECQ